MSQPCMVGPNSARLGAGFARLVSGDFVALLIYLSCFVGRSENKKPTTVASRGFLSKWVLASTSPGGVAIYYDDYQRQGYYLSRLALHSGEP